MSKVSTICIGDGKLPNKYWVSIHNDYYYLNDGCYDWVSDREKTRAKSKTLKVFATYKQAKDYFDSLIIGDCIDGIQIMGKNIEDRFTGQLCEEVFVESTTCKCCGHTTENDTLYNEDLKFTKDKLREQGVEFQ